ncbi:MAG TPA: PAS domain S-box protein, partial [Candidatus Cybelea sp.]|nr:PAS domain S-box protein [Candidatus Cybelea sp.]
MASLGSSINDARRHRLSAVALVIAWGVAAGAILTAFGFAHLFTTFMRDALGAVIVVLLTAVLWVYAWRPLAEELRAGRRHLLLADAVDKSRSGLMIVSRKGEVVYANAAYREHLALPAEGDALPLDAVFAVDEAARERIRRLHHSAVAGGTAVDEAALTLRDGSKRWLKITSHGIAGLAGDVLWRLEDVTAEHEMQEAIKAEQEKLADFIDNAPVGFYSADAADRLQFANGTLARWLGVLPSDLVTGNVRLGDVLTFDDPASQGPRRGEASLRARDGSVRRVRVTQSMVRNTEGGTIATRSVVYDLTQELAWQRALRQAEEHFRHFFDYAPIGIVVLDESQRVQEANAAFRAMVGDAAAVQGRDFLQLIRKRDRASVTERLAASDRDPAALEVRLNVESERVAQLYISRLEPDSPAGVSGRLLHLIDT